MKLIKWLIIYALYEKIKRDNGITSADINIHTITQALKDLNPEEMARNLFNAVHSILQEPAVKDFVNTLFDFIFRFLQALFGYYSSGGM